MYKKILVPLDGSEFSARILPHVKAVATGCKVPKVILLMVEEGRDLADDMVKGRTATIMGYLSGVAADLKEEGIDTETVVLWGHAAEEIVDYVKNNQVDMVMMSTHGRSGASRWLLGSVTNRVVRHAASPVFVASPKSLR
jgi:nucleotide-binding universal stress UspA family protein